MWSEGKGYKDASRLKILLSHFLCNILRCGILSVINRSHPNSLTYFFSQIPSHLAITPSGLHCFPLLTHPYVLYVSMPYYWKFLYDILLFSGLGLDTDSWQDELFVGVLVANCCYSAVNAVFQVWNNISKCGKLLLQRRHLCIPDMQLHQHLTNCCQSVCQICIPGAT